ncbi:hypothetical protein BN130_1879 [Cronobacter malonaticus 507]|nr:hypothetical protein BN130_1879 [Cronobacter malonaticus 507]
MIWMSMVNAKEGKQALFTLSLSGKATKKASPQASPFYIGCRLSES